MPSLEEMAFLPGQELPSLALEERFRRLFLGYAAAINKQQGRRGSLFQKPFKRLHLTNQAHLPVLIHYIHRNPVHYGFAERFDHWRFSSYAGLLDNRPTRLARDKVLDLFGGADAFIRFHGMEPGYGEIGYCLEDADVPRA